MDMLSYDYKSENEKCNDVWRQWDEYCWVYWSDECEQAEMTIWHDEEEDEECYLVNMQKKKTKNAK